MKGIAYIVLRFWLYFFFMLVTSPVAGIAILLLKYAESHEEWAPLQWICIPVLLLWVFGVPWFAHTTAAHMAFENRSLGCASKCTILDVRLRMAFLPFIGKWFAPVAKDQRDEAP